MNVVFCVIQFYDFNKLQPKKDIDAELENELMGSTKDDEKNRRKSESSVTSGGKWKKIGRDSPIRDRTYSQKSDLTNGEKSFENEKNDDSSDNDQENQKSNENENGNRSRSRSRSCADSSDDINALTALREAALGSLGKFKKTENDQNMRESESDDEDLDKMRTLLLSTKSSKKKSQTDLRSKLKRQPPKVHVNPALRNTTALASSLSLTINNLQRQVSTQNPALPRHSSTTIVRRLQVSEDEDIPSFGFYSYKKVDQKTKKIHSFFIKRLNQ
ncbi:unnamed protein product [Oikopleura dioica]|uniref:Uncharacterized protein n=1 Tax=Oikopleura dioica TaxID=34765 RepID=E4Y3U5_OIKDI|nr:unnamed protein product [Oikopleura dioica]